MEPIVNLAVEAYAREHSSPESELLRELAEETYETMESPRMLVGRVQGTLLRLLVQLSNARRVLELGTFTGYSALSMAEGLPADGALITCDVDPKATGVARRYWDRSPHGQKITLKLGPAMETLGELEGPFDFVFIDADKENYIAYWEKIVPLVSQDGLIVADNVLWKGRVLKPESALDYAIDTFNKHVADDERVEGLIITVRDGVTIARKK